MLGLLPPDPSSFSQTPSGTAGPRKASPIVDRFSTRTGDYIRQNLAGQTDKRKVEDRRNRPGSPRSPESGSSHHGDFARLRRFQTHGFERLRSPDHPLPRSPHPPLPYVSLSPPPPFTA